jgi:hypothetical protein
MSKDAQLFLGFVAIMFSLLMGAILLSEHQRNDTAIKLIGEGIDPIKAMCLIDGIDGTNRELCMGAQNKE